MDSYNRYRLISSIVFLFIYLLVRYPWQTVILTGIIITAYAIVNNIGSSTMIDRNSRTDRRIMALNACSMFLSPYRNMWKNLKLSNKFCSLRLGASSNSITARDSQNSYRYFIVTDSKIHSYEDLWNMFCYRFSYNTTFDELIELANRFKAQIELTEPNKINIQPSGNSQYNTQTWTKTDIFQNQNIPEKKEPLDVNNASEIELTALPGVSIVMAKKLIKKREEIGGFKSIQDVCLFLKLKPHMQNQLEKLACVKKMKGSLKIDRYNERSVDI